MGTLRFKEFHVIHSYTSPSLAQSPTGVPNLMQDYACIHTRGHLHATAASPTFPGTPIWNGWCWNSTVARVEMADGTPTRPTRMSS